MTPVEMAAKLGSVGALATEYLRRAKIYRKSEALYGANQEHAAAERMKIKAELYETVFDELNRELQFKCLCDTQ